MSSRSTTVLAASIFLTIMLVGGVIARARIHDDPDLVGAGDIASCSSSGDEATAKLLDGMPAATNFTAGDNFYEDGTAAEISNCYNPSWGRHKARTFPAVGNHEYQTADASGYFDYFGAAGDPNKGYYSYDLGEWHIISLNSMCENVGRCGASSTMVEWLKEDLAANPSSCTLAYWHHPLFSSGSEHGNDPKMRPSWDVLYAAGADVMVNGHDHDYERFAPQTPGGWPTRSRRKGSSSSVPAGIHFTPSSPLSPTARCATSTPLGS